jgi:transcription antitermination factor NusG
MPGPPFRPLYNAYSSDKLQKYGVEPGRGDEIEVAAGPFKSLRGAFKKDVSDQDPVIILLDYVSHQGRLLIEKSKLKKVVD